VSPFLFKTWNLVSDPTTDHIVSWAPDGLTFVVHKPDAMVRASHCLCACVPSAQRASCTAHARAARRDTEFET
jgi:HSF-type DNA-binding